MISNATCSSHATWCSLGNNTSRSLRAMTMSSRQKRPSSFLSHSGRQIGAKPGTLSSTTPISSSGPSMDLPLRCIPCGENRIGQGRHLVALCNPHRSKSTALSKTSMSHPGCNSPGITAFGSLRKQLMDPWMTRCNWFGTDRKMASVTAAKCQDSLGLARAQHKFAIRVRKTAFAAMWKQIFPSVDPPPTVDTKATCKIDNLPFGVNSRMLQEWAAHVTWTLRPLRPLGPRAWLIGCPAPPGDGKQLFFSGQPVLIRVIPNKQQIDSHPVISAPKPVQTMRSTHGSLPPLNGWWWSLGGMAGP